ncbi:MAG: amino acid adenylation domain-containing protein [Acidobacteria bacterium]|nr:amino acid adenylation domain-containing protein [Acidobacteriota bacterium]MCW5968207.1 amino acid adenylation domain-containing protein [Blastocatellales bacterium]
MGVERFPLSPMQQAMLVHSLAAPGAGFYIQQISVDLPEPVASEPLRLAFTEIAARYDILRACILWEGRDEPEHEIRSEAVVDWSEIDWTDPDIKSDNTDEADQEELETRFAVWLATDRAREFAPDEAPPWRVALIRLGREHYRLVWTFHHLLLDGRSHTLLLREVFERAAALSEGREIDASRASAFSEFIRWQRSQDFSAGAEFWREMLRGMTRNAALPVRRNKPEDARSIAAAGLCKIKIADQVVRGLRDLAEREAVTLNTLVQAGWAVLLGRRLDADDVVFGAARACRHWTADGPRRIGLFINTLPMRTRIPNDAETGPWLRELRELQVALREYEHTPLPLIRKWSPLPPGAKLFETILVFENFDLSGYMQNLGANWARRTVVLHERTPGLSLGAYGGEGLSLVLEYDPAVYEAEAVAGLLDEMRGILEGFASGLPVHARVSAIAAPDAHTPDEYGGESLPRAADYPPLTEDERRRMLYEWNETALDADLSRTVVDRVDEIARIRPDALAIAEPKGREISYSEFVNSAGRLARRLNELGVAPERAVAVLLEHGIDLIVATLGIWKAGGAFLPLDPAWPERRQDFLIDDADAAVIVTTARRAERFSGRLPVVVIDEETDGRGDYKTDDADLPPVPGPRPETRAYLIYTSGSTGEPKGVEVEHRHLANLCAYYQAGLGLTPADRSSTLAGVAFDATFTDVWPYLTIGASVHVPPAECRYDARALISWLHGSHITCSFVSTALAESALREQWPEDIPLRVFLTGGDKLYALPVRNYPFAILNTYGPTECTVDSTWAWVDPAGADAGAAPPIGRPVANARAYVLDPERQPLPVGVAGELYIGGAGVARGYLNRPVLTSERFLPDSFAGGGARMYRTGDLVRYRPDGVIEFIGRADHQVQVRGVRVELGEIEAALKAQRIVCEAAVIAHEVDGAGLQLAAFVGVEKASELRSGNGESADAAELLRRSLRERLPEAMVPASIQVLQMLPKNAAGKIDRTRLAGMIARRSSAASGTEEQTPNERLLAGVWRRVLDVEDAGRDDGFFDLGGHSLLLMKLQGEIEKASGIRLSIPSLLQHTTIAQQAALLDGQPLAARRTALIALREVGDGRPFFFVPGAGGGTHWFGDLTSALDPAIPCYGFEPAALGVKASLQSSIEKLAEEFIAGLRRVQKRGPYRLVGYSMGSLVAFEAARRLVQDGERIEVLAAIEGWVMEPNLTAAQKLRRAMVNLWRLDRSNKLEYVRDKLGYTRRMLNKREQPAEISAAEAEIAPLREAHIAAALNYRPQVYEGGLLLFRARRYPATAPSDPHCGWGDWVRGGVELHWVPGDHYQVVVAPNCEVIARALMSAAHRGKNR